jgi:phage terminase small subunit
MTHRKAAPKHLSRSSAALWRRIQREIDLEPHEIPLLKAFCESVDRAEEARRAVEQEGAYYRDFRGQPKPHPAPREERDSRLAASRLLRELRLANREATEEPSAEPVPGWLADDAESDRLLRGRPPRSEPPGAASVDPVAAEGLP